MLFKDIKQNYPVYILNKQDLSLTQGSSSGAVSSYGNEPENWKDRNGD